MYSENATYSASDVITLLIAGTPVTAYMTSTVSGDHKWSGSVNVTNIKITAPFEGNTTFTCTLEGTGALTPTTI
jgi:predicted secreted protein